jgi:hypothetical protein
VRFAHSDGCTDGCTNGCTIRFYRCHAYANYNADIDTRSGKSLCHAKTCSGEYFYGERSSSERNCGGH